MGRTKSQPKRQVETHEVLVEAEAPILVQPEPEVPKPPRKKREKPKAEVIQEDAELQIDTECDPPRIECLASSNAVEVSHRLLRRIRLSYQSNTNQAIVIRTGRDTTALLQLVANLTDTDQAIATCVREGLLIAILHSNCLEFYITPQAMEQTQLLPINARPSKKYRAGQLVQAAVATLFPLEHSPQIVTAKQVYALTDNQQLLRAKQPIDDLFIPGLVPQLRPYQKAAVHWMMQRELNPTENDEWKVLWVACQPDGQVTSELQNATILLCPFTGWMASSIEEAKALMGPLSTVKGGILAEQMGLGKSVEVIACILGNRRNMKEVTAASPTAKRKLLFEDNGGIDIERTEHDTSNVGIVDEIGEFGDAEDSDDDDDDVSLAQSISQSERPNVAVVTPDKIETRWLDPSEDGLGSCICGNIIQLRDCRRKCILLCPECDEPMHRECAAYDTDDDARKVCTPILFRKEHTHEDGKAFLMQSYHRCPCCVAETGEKIESRATLIVTPAAILDQWNREISRHARREDGTPMKVAVYDGVDRICKSYGPRKSDVVDHMKTLHASILADNDIVLVTFDTLHRSLGHSDENRFVGSSIVDGASNLRKRKRYRVVPSPLGLIDWWRVCLDEAQRVETPTAGSARMALKLSAHFRWCVSGTPIGRGKIDDLYGLLLFLRLDPFAVQSLFQKCFDSGTPGVDGRITSLLSNIFWRSTKTLDQVREQMRVPEQVEKKVYLSFSSIEKHFYERQKEQALLTVGDVVERENSGKKRKESQISLLSEQLHRLRAACCHPQVGSSGIGSLKRGKRTRNATERGTSSSVGVGLDSKIMSMNQILDRFIDDAKLKCEESQRLALMHTNAMASLSRLKVEAKSRGVVVKESDQQLLEQSCKLYMESLGIAETNAKATPVVGEILLEGTTGFQSPMRLIRDGKAKLEWKPPITEALNVSCMFHFEGPARRIKEFRLRSFTSIPAEHTSTVSRDFHWTVLLPKRVIFQVSNPNMGGDFADVCEVLLPDRNGDESELITSGDFRTYKSKSWKMVVKSFHDTANYREWKLLCASDEKKSAYVGIELELFEATIANDPLQRLHCLHNALISFEELSALEGGSSSIELENKKRVLAMGQEANLIESMYLESARSIHLACSAKLEEMTSLRREKEAELFSLGSTPNNKNSIDCWSDCWWDDFLSACVLYGSEGQKEDLFNRLTAALDGIVRRRHEVATGNRALLFPHFDDLIEFRAHLKLRLDAIRCDGIGGQGGRRSILLETDDQESEKHHQRFKCPQGKHRRIMVEVSKMSENPGDGEVLENSVCHVCKADWNQRGPKCRHCKLGEQLSDLEPDHVTTKLFGAIEALSRGSTGTQILRRAEIEKEIEARSKAFFVVLDAQKRERLIASRFWRIHLDLLNDVDELNQCKGGMRLTYEDEDLTQLTDDQMNGVVVPIDIHVRFNDHAAKQAMALGDLRRAEDTLRYLKNQSVLESEADCSKERKEDCVVCLSKFDEEKAVLKCGHAFHYSPCLERLTRTNGMIACPMRCRVRTSQNEVMIASTRKTDDGSKAQRSIVGSWGTKVSQLVSDVLDVSDQGEKCVVFSQWEDMLDIVGEAFKSNGVSFVRATSLRKIGECTRRFRSQDCTALLLNVKNGAEGLTILEATHVFMLEAILNHGLDSQAINRIHRIGQSKKTFVHRYLMRNTIEEKIDELRLDHQDDQIEDSLNEGRKSGVKAGGIDGGLDSSKIMELLAD